MTDTTRIIPAIDLKDGRCVRLEQGRFDTSKVYRDDPLAVARAYVDDGATLLHLVDLDAAQGEGRHNTHLIERMAAQLDVALQVGGGIRERSQVDALRSAGAARVVIGSLAIRNADLVKQWLEDLGAAAIVLALDVTSGADPMVQIHGWQTPTETTLWQALDDYVPLGLRHLLCTDISRDGMRSGPSVELYAEVMRRFTQLRLQASGGVRDRTDLAALSAAGVPFAISGRGLLEGTLSLKDGAPC
jgi:phosphoribosylformimino-5-aminoimidazole carboxamide ribotide isomerase